MIIRESKCGPLSLDEDASGVFHLEDSYGNSKKFETRDKLSRFLKLISVPPQPRIYANKPISNVIGFGYTFFVTKEAKFIFSKIPLADSLGLVSQSQSSMEVIPSLPYQGSIDFRFWRYECDLKVHNDQIAIYGITHHERVNLRNYSSTSSKPIITVM